MYDPSSFLYISHTNLGMNRDSHHEVEPLLRSSDASTSSFDSEQPRSYWRRPWFSQDSNNDGLSRETKTVICVLCLQFLISFAKHIIEVPTIRLFEIAICNRYYRNSQALGPSIFNGGLIDESNCKLPQIQNELAFLVGWRFSFDALPGILTALIYGRLADRIGRRTVLFLSCVGLLGSLVWIVVVCYANEVLPVKLVWASGMFVLIVSVSVPTNVLHLTLLDRAEGNVSQRQWCL